APPARPPASRARPGLPAIPRAFRSRAQPSRLLQSNSTAPLPSLRRRSDATAITTSDRRRRRNSSQPSVNRRCLGRAGRPLPSLAPPHEAVSAPVEASIAHHAPPSVHQSRAPAAAALSPPAPGLSSRFLRHAPHSQRQQQVACVVLRLHDRRPLQRLASCR